MLRLLTLLVFLVCSALPVSAGCLDDVPYHGGWEWVSTEYTEGGTETPATVGYTEQILVVADGVFGGTFIRYRDEIPVEESFWGWTDMLVGNTFVEIFSLGDETWYNPYVTMEPCELLLQDGCYVPGAGGPPTTVTKTYLYVGTVAADTQTWSHLKATYRTAGR